MTHKPGARPTESPEQAPNEQWSTPLGLAIASSSLAVLLALGTTIVGFKIDPGDDANYIVTGLAAVIAALNVLFTLWLLRTAQRQLSIMREQAIEQHKDSTVQITQLKASHDAERKEANQQLNSLREQLELARDQHAAERREAASTLKVSQDEVDESLKARLDQLAPRVSVAIEGHQLILKERNTTEVITSKHIPELETLEGHANTWLELVFRFSVKNWGSEPVIVTLPSPWTSTGSSLLFPGDSLKLTHEFPIATYSLRQIAESGLSQNPSKPEWVFTVLVDDLGGEVHDYHVWRIIPMPFRLELGKIVHNKDFDRAYSKFASRQRRYHFLDQRTLDAGLELDGPRL